MAARLTALLPRLLALTVIWLLGAATFTLAADKPPATPKAATAPDAARPDVLVVPDVRGKAYVFAEGILQDAGFAWTVQGPVQGYSANLVAVQSPAPQTRVIDNGSPTVVLRLLKNSKYRESGLPQNDAPTGGTRIVYLTDWRRQHAQSQTTTTVETTTAVTTTTAETSTGTTTEQSPPPTPKTRKPDFVVQGAPAEPADEITLPARAQRLSQRVAQASKPTPRLVNFWLYQHAWIVTGARFGWHDGAEALRILIKVDESLQRRFDFGSRSEQVARRTLAEVEAKAK
jgi:PASTA domain-containing protein